MIWKLQKPIFANAFWKKELELLSRLLKTFGMKDVKEVVNAHSCDGDMAKKTSIVLFQLGREITIGEGSKTELKLGVVQIPVALDELNGVEIFWMCASVNMAIYAIVMTKFTVNGNLVTLQLGSSQLFSENDSITKFEVEQSSTNSPSFLVFHYYLEVNVDVAHYTTINALLNAEIKML